MPGGELAEDEPLRGPGEEAVAEELGAGGRRGAGCPASRRGRARTASRARTPTGRGDDRADLGVREPPQRGAAARPRALRAAPPRRCRGSRGGTGSRSASRIDRAERADAERHRDEVGQGRVHAVRAARGRSGPSRGRTRMPTSEAANGRPAAHAGRGHGSAERRARAAPPRRRPTPCGTSARRSGRAGTRGDGRAPRRGRRTPRTSGVERGRSVAASSVLDPWARAPRRRHIPPAPGAASSSRLHLAQPARVDREEEELLLAASAPDPW